MRIDQDTESIGSAFSGKQEDEIANQIKLDYKGEDDAIFQEVQAGNTTLELPGTRFVGFRPTRQGALRHSRQRTSWTIGLYDGGQPREEQEQSPDV